VIRPLFLIFFTALCLPAFAHEVRPAYLELRETAPGEFNVLWKTPMLGDARLSLAPKFSPDVDLLGPIVSRRSQDAAAIQTWRIRTPQLRGSMLAIAGLEHTMTDALVQIEFLDGSKWTQRLMARNPSATIPLRPAPWSIAGTYLVLGVEHILLGFDHLLFILALIIITGAGWKLIKTVTAFTVAHSLTLSAAALGFVHVPTKPVEAIIALSIVFVASEIIADRRGRPGLTARAPWIVAFAFGLLHGLGFAGALSEVGLPDGQIPLALFFFSVGVEIGHFLFVGCVLILIAGITPWRRRMPQWLRLVPVYGIGSVAMFWLIERVSTF